MQPAELRPATITGSFGHVITSDGEKVRLDDPRVTHVLPLDLGRYRLGLLANVLRKRGWKCRIGTETTMETLQYAKELANGRECLPCAAILGETCKDLLHRREPEEISIYYNLDQEGPCQNGIWPTMWQTFMKRKGIKNAVFCTWPSQRNNYLGRWDLFALEIALAFIVGDVLEEAEFTVRCLAKDKEEGTMIFRREAAWVLESARRGYGAVEIALRRWAQAVKQIELQGLAEETPKVLLFGGANLLFAHYPVSDYFLEQDIIPKLVDLSEFLIWLESEDVTRYGFKIGQTRDGKQMRVLPVVLSLFNPKYSTVEGLQALRCRAHISVLDYLLKRFRNIGRKSGLVYDEHISFKTLYAEGSKHVSPNGFTETHINTARFVATAGRTTFDGLVNVGSFNCQPAMNTQACVRWLANEVNVPYASIDCEGPIISATQRRLLEVVAVQARRLRNARTARKAPEAAGPALTPAL